MSPPIAPTVTATTMTTPATADHATWNSGRDVAGEIRSNQPRSAPTIPSVNPITQAGA
jgi:hypothetical protein